MRIGNMSFGFKLSFIIGLCAVTVAVLLGLSLSILHDAVLKERQFTSQSAVEVVHGMLVKYVELEKRGLMTHDEAVAAALEVVRGARYGQGEYFFISDLHGLMLMHPIKKELEGRNLADLQDTNGHYFYREFFAKARQNGFVSYYWPKPGQRESVEKLSYVKALTPWNMMIISGVYMDDVRDRFNDYARTLLLTGAAGIALIIVAAAAFRRHMVRPLAVVTEAMNRLTAGETDVVVAATTRGDEVGVLSQAVATFSDNLRHIRQLEAAATEERLRFIDRQARHLEEIERAVAERTSALSEALDTLKLAQDELLRSEKMAALGGMVAAIAHEINTPLGNSVTVATTLKEKIVEFDRMVAGNELRRSSLREFSQSLGAGVHLLVGNLARADELIASFKRVAVDQTSERRRVFDLATTTHEIVTMLWPTYKKTGHRVDIEIGEGIAIDGYPGAFSQVVTNLVANAVLHAFDGRRDGVIRIASTFCDDDDDVDAITLTVTDNGAGIPPKILSRIFDPFFTTKFGSGGSGLGLHIVYATVSRVLGGRISVDSEVGTGTTFTLRLPRTAPVHETAAAD